MVSRCQVSWCPPLRSGAALSGLAMSTLATWSHVVQSRDVSPHNFDGLVMSGLAFSVALLGGGNKTIILTQVCAVWVDLTLVEQLKRHSSCLVPLMSSKHWSIYHWAICNVLSGVNCLQHNQLVTQSSITVPFDQFCVTAMHVSFIFSILLS